jgi:cytosine/adenosine deaminase-related metal-dependent hydrolase
VIKNVTCVTMNAQREVVAQDLRIENERIVEIGKNLKSRPGETTIDASHCWVIPGLIQVHTHLVQALFRGLADDLELLDWLQRKIWPFEKAHNEASLRAAARIGILEMQTTGTTTIVDMGTTTGIGTVFEEAEASGLRYFGGNCFMDLKSASGSLYRPLDESLRETEDLIQAWHKKTPLLEYVIAPRFAISCTEKMMRAGVDLQKQHGLLLHTHASENKQEVALIKKRTGLGNVDYLNKLGLLNDKAVIAHGIHLSKSEAKKIVHACAGLAHCPASNMKLASGFAPIPDYLKMGMKIGLGTDGAPCNNTHDGFLEMRFAGLIHKPKFGPRSMPAEEVFRLATLGGAEVIGREKDLGSLEKGKLADIVIVARSNSSLATVENAYSSLVYSSTGRDVRDVLIHGREIVRDRRHLLLDEGAVISNARSELKILLSRT